MLMGQRNILCTHQMLDLEAEQPFTHLHPENCIILGDTFGYADNMHPVLSGPGNSVDLGRHQFRGHHDQSTYFGNQYNNIQNCHHVLNHENCHNALNHDFGGTVLPNFLNPFTFPSTSSRIFPVPENIGSIAHHPSSLNNTSMGLGMDEFYGRDADSIRESCKRKTAEVVPGNYSHANGSASSSSSSLYQYEYSCFPQWDAAAFTPTEFQGHGILPTVVGSHRSVRSRPSAISLQPESVVAHHQNYLFEGSNMGQAFQPANNNTWMVQSESSIGDGGVSTWNNTRTMNYMHGRSLSSGMVEAANMGMQGYQESSSSSFLSYHASMPNFCHHLAPGQNMQIHSYGHHVQIPATYQHPHNNLDQSSVNPSSNVQDSNSSFPVFPSSAEITFRQPQHLPQPTLEVSHGDFRILSSQYAAFMELSRFYGVESVFDQHRDMRLDIDNMSYEELLALEEQIGDVNTGLTEQSIIKNLRINVYNSQRASCLQDHSCPENETCAVCQIEYMQKERIGTLDCGHYYHTDCIKQWLLVKNRCPICKETALAVNGTDG